MATTTKKATKQPDQDPIEAFFKRPGTKKAWWLVVLPTLVYFALFCLFTWPWITHFNRDFFTDVGDGLQNVWNMWWIDKSVGQLHVLPWFTTYLHAPWGVTLVGQTLNPINGFVGIILMHFMSLMQAFNVMITFAFIFGGLTMFWLCRYLTKAYVPSLIGGAMFTFSSYHFAHALGHMQLVSLEFIPLFVLLWWKLLIKPGYRLAVGAALALLLVLFCDYYYFLYSLLMAVFIAGYLLYRKDITIDAFRQKQNWRPLLVFVVLCLVLVAPLPVALLKANAHGGLVGAHDARTFSTDLASPFIDGGFWHFSSWTHLYWGHVRAYIAESTVYLGVSVWLLLVIAIWKRGKIHRDVVFWIGVGLFFGILSLGPRLLVNGDTIEHFPLPYALAEHIVPSLRLSGVPVRMMVMVTFAATILVAMVLAKVDIKKRRGQLLVGLFCVVLAFEMWPMTLPLTPDTQPRYVIALKALPAGVVLDNAAPDGSEQLLHQTSHEHKMILGYISRTPQKLLDEEGPMVSDITLGKYTLLCQQYKLRYFTTPATRPLKTNFPIVYQDNQAIIYDLKNSPNC
jgi:hypothetical protein